MKKLIIFLMMLICMPMALATVTYTINSPANLYGTIAQNITFDWNATSDDTTQPAGMTTWLYLSDVNNDTAVVNVSVLINNDTWGNNTNIASLSIGFYSWYLVTNDSDGNTTSLSRWFEIKNETEEVFFIWENNTGFEAMRLNRNTGDMTIRGTTTLDSTLDVAGDTAIVGDLDVSNNFTGNQIYGGMWNYTANATSWTYIIDAADIYYNLTNLSVGDVNGFNFTAAAAISGGSYLTALKAGTYQVHSDVSAEALASTALYSLAVVKNFNVSNSQNCYARRDIGTAVGSFSVSCYLNIDVGDKINIQIENEENTNNIKFHTVNLVLTRVGD